MKKKNYIGNFHNKGFAFVDGLFFMLAIIVFIVASIFGYYIWNQLAPDVLIDLEHNESKEIVNTVSNDFPGIVNGSIIFIFIGFWLFLLISAFLSTDYPILFFVLMVVMIFMLLISMYVTNIYEDIMLDAELVSLTTTFAIPHFIMTHLLQFNLGILLLSIILAIGKNKYEG